MGRRNVSLPAVLHLRRNMRANPEDVLRELEEMAKRLAARKCFYLAAVLLRDYDGDCAAETKTERLKSAGRYSELSREQCLLSATNIEAVASANKPKR